MSILERIAYICLISLCVISGTVLIREDLSRNSTIGRASLITEKSLVGKRLVISGEAWNESRLSAVFFLSSQCHFCDASMPFYRRLVDAQQKSGAGRLPLIAISREQSSTLREHFAQNQITFDRIYQVPQSFNLLAGTPTILFVDETGIIRHAYIGKLNSEQEQEVLSLFDDHTVAETCRSSQKCSV